MESSVSMVTTIEKIKLQEFDKETKLREKRTIEALMASTNRALRETTSQAAKFKDEILEVTARADAVNAELCTEQVRRSALGALLDESDKELKILKEKSEQGITKVWQLRNLLCDKVQETSDHCDVWALFAKPKHIESSTSYKKNQYENAKKELQQDGILKCALRKRQSLLEERDRLLNEPDSGEEFKRIKNAVRYSEEMAGQLKL